MKKQGLIYNFYKTRDKFANFEKKTIIGTNLQLFYELDGPI